MQSALQCVQCTASLVGTSTCLNCYAPFCGRCVIANAGKKTCSRCQQPTEMLQNDVLNDISLALVSFLDQISDAKSKTAETGDQSTRAGEAVADERENLSDERDVIVDVSHQHARDSVFPTGPFPSGTDKHANAENIRDQESVSINSSPVHSDSEMGDLVASTMSTIGNDTRDCAETGALPNQDYVLNTGTAVGNDAKATASNSPSSDTTPDVKATGSTSHCKKTTPIQPPQDKDDDDFVESPDFKRRTGGATRRSDKARAVQDEHITSPRA